MDFTWDARKNRRNVKLHGIAFEDAARIFDGPTVERVDDRFDYGEERVYAIGVVEGIEITVVYADVVGEGGEVVRRLISAWKAVKHEREAYWEGIGEVGD